METTNQHRAVPPPLPGHTKKKKSTLGFWIVIIFLLLSLGGSILLNIGLAAGLRSQIIHPKLSNKGYDEFPEFNEVWSYGDGTTKVVRIILDGIIMRHENQGLFEPPEDKIESILAQIRTAQNDPDIRAIIFEVNSPGGSITPSDEIYAALQRFKASAPNRKVIVFMRDLAASGGYYVAMAGDYLMAEPTSIVGSIGVLMQGYNIKGLAEKIGVQNVTIKSGENKDLLNPFKEINPAQIKLLQDMVDTMYNRFSTLVQENRSLSSDIMKKWGDGRIFTSQEAVENGFIDSIGYWNDLLKKTAELLGQNSIRVIRYEQEYNFFDVLMRARIRNPIPHVLEYKVPRFLYLWTP